MLDNSDRKYLEDILPFLKDLEAADVRLIMSAAFKAKYAPGEIILSREKECSGVIIVKSGQLRSFLELEDGKEITLYRLLEGDLCVLSASCVLKNITFEITLEAEKPSELCFIPALVWGKLVDKNSAVKEFSMEMVSERFSEVMWVMEQMVTRNMGQRVAAFLLEQSVLENSRTLTITHETIARNLGTAREVISRTLKYLENDGVLHLSRGQIQLTDMKKLREMGR